MSTRHTSSGAPLSQERYMSSPEYADRRGLSGMAVAAKVELQTDPRVRSLLLFIQALSLHPGGIEENVANKILAMFPERLGTKSMHRFGVKPGTIYKAEQVRVVREEFEDSKLSEADRAWERQRRSLHQQAAIIRGEEPEPPTYNGDFPLKADGGGAHPTSYPASHFIEACRLMVNETLEHFLIELCINPRVGMSGHPCFHDIIGALLEFQARHEQAAREALAETTVSKQTFRTLERGLHSRKIVVVNGNEGIGKTFSGEAWCETRLGQARFIRLRGNQTEATFYSAIWVACGLGSPVNRKVQELRSRVDRFIEQTGMMLVIDEGHRLMPQSERIYAQPSLMNWIYGLWDIKVPCALLVTPQFVSRMDEVERQTDWRSGQFKRRVECWTDLPQKLTQSDLGAVARSRAPRYTPSMIAELVDFAEPARRQIDAMARAISAAEFIAREEGRTAPIARDLLAGIDEAQQTDLALTTRLDMERQAKGRAGSRQRRGRTRAAVLPSACEDPAEDMDSPGADTLPDTDPIPRAVTPRRVIAVPA